MTARHVVFDIGNVLLDWDPRHLYRTLFPGRPDGMEWFLRHICSPAWNLEQDGGRSWAAGVGQRVASFPEWRAEIEAFDRRWHDMIAGEITGTVAILTALQGRGVRLFAITNFSADKHRETLARFRFLDVFEGVIVSGDERLLKPAAAIFDLLATRYGVKLADCVFIDDNAENVAGAAATGMIALRFTGPEALRADLGRLGFAL